MYCNKAIDVNTAKLSLFRQSPFTIDVTVEPWQTVGVSGEPRTQQTGGTQPDVPHWLNMPSTDQLLRQTEEKAHRPPSS